MKKTLYIILTGLVILVIACSKYNNLKDVSPTGTPSYLFGKLLLSDTQTQNVTDKPLGSKTVYICFSESYDGLNYLYSTTTDADGYFKFTQLNSAKNYVVFYKEVTSGATFSAKSENLALPQDKYVLRASLLQTGQTGILATVQDVQGNPLKGATVCFGTSSLPMKNNVCDGTNYSAAATDELGHASLFNVAPNTYYALAKLTINNVVYTDTATIQVIAGTLLSKIFKIKTAAAPVTTTSLSLQLNDATGSAVAGGRFCLFTSRIVFARDTCEGSNYSVPTDVTGKGIITNIPPGKYYILGELPLKTGKLLGHDSVTVGSSPVSITMRLK